MRKNYKLYEVRLINGIMMYQHVGIILAMNIIEAEFLFEAQMKTGVEYQITIPH